MSWAATERFRARPAPAGLVLVQELVNTHAVDRDGEELLADRSSAQRWLQNAGQQWAEVHGLQCPDLVLDESGLRELLDLRSTVAGLLAVPADERPAGAPVNIKVRVGANLLSDAEGRVGIEPVGTGSGWLVSAVWSEILLAQLTGTWARLKVCREPGCRSAFYDTSRNRSGLWHDVHSCGNINNLRVSRTRRKESAQ
ncbi:CGNR zinc finger domain-containing protein [Kribbella albertanoniae]|uniref:CGNR zinc finger domain-containing protein n=1 Tax=Kribbella albertanoniae TaxID=1266829 RepID=A0A4R4Q3Z7_9ACTN|nr:CGNR zinc finger domain-containing protein [Kribbella albertanoniae]TDC29806.1 CGNR zinc finger domain-containing protein [Kribbella albertanoniae]